MAKTVRAGSTTSDVEFESDTPQPTATVRSKVVKMKTKTETAEKEKKPRATKASTVPPKYTGRTTGLRVQAFQDKLMKDNYRAKLTDEQLATAMRDEFPAAVAFTIDHVRGIRSMWNHGKRASQNGELPAKPLGEYDADGNVVVRFVEAKAKAAKTARDAKAAKVAKAKVKKTA